MTVTKEGEYFRPAARVLRPVVIHNLSNIFKIDARLELSCNICTYTTYITYIYIYYKYNIIYTYIYICIVCTYILVHHLCTLYLISDCFFVLPFGPSSKLDRPLVLRTVLHSPQIQTCLRETTRWRGVHAELCWCADPVDPGFTSKIGDGSKPSVILYIGKPFYTIRIYSY